MTNLRTAAAAPAYVWPADAHWIDGRLRIKLERITKTSVSDAVEVVDVALTMFEVTDEPPDGADLVFPSGATLGVGMED